MLTPKMMEELRQESLTYARYLKKVRPCRAGTHNNCVVFEWDCDNFYSCKFSGKEEQSGE